MFSILFYFLYRPWISLHEYTHMGVLELSRADYNYRGYVPDRQAFVVEHEATNFISFITAISPILLSVFPVSAFYLLEYENIPGIAETTLLIYIGIFGAIAAVPSMQDSLSASSSCLTEWSMIPLLPFALSILLPLYVSRRLGIGWFVSLWWIAYCRFLALEIVPQVISL